MCPTSHVGGCHILLFLPDHARLSSLNFTVRKILDDQRVFVSLPLFFHFLLSKQSLYETFYLSIYFPLSF